MTEEAMVDVEEGVQLKDVILADNRER